MKLFALKAQSYFKKPCVSPLFYCHWPTSKLEVLSFSFFEFFFSSSDGRKDLNPLSCDHKSNVQPLFCCHRPTSSYLFHFFPFFSSGANGRIETLYVVIMSQIFYHCSTATGKLLNLKTYCFLIFYHSLSASARVGFKPLIL